MALPFEFIITGPPVSQQARRRARLREWQEEIRHEAVLRWPYVEFPYPGSVQITIIYFYDQTSLDVDNIPKPILDALKGLVYIDDEQITDIICRKRSLLTELRVENPAIVEALASGDEFLYILAEAAPNQEELML